MVAGVRGVVMAVRGVVMAVHAVVVDVHDIVLDGQVDDTRALVPAPILPAAALAEHPAKTK